MLQFVWTYYLFPSIIFRDREFHCVILTRHNSTVIYYHCICNSLLLHVTQHIQVWF